MQGRVPPDPSGIGVSQPVYATVYMPKFKTGRHRFPASCICVYDSDTEALKAAALNPKQFAAQVLGPSKSSEGQYIYYLLKWL